jgi:hypothetical protein
MQVKDLLDILLVAAVLYVVLAWLRLSLPHGVARRSMVAAPIAGTVYVLAPAFDLYLLEQVLEGLLIVVPVAAVVVVPERNRHHSWISVSDDVCRSSKQGAQHAGNERLDGDRTVIDEAQNSEEHRG